MSHRLKSYITRLRIELMSVLMMSEPEVWEQVRTAEPDAQVDALFKSPAIRRFICEHALGQAGYEKDGVVQRLRNGGLYQLESLSIDWDQNGYPANVLLFGRPLSNTGDAAAFLGRISDFLSVPAGIPVSGPEILDLVR
ncbi:hypothetical protein [Pseudomonas sp. PLB05]|uniref:hypothetical protein n=1 Tax=Pseudomonas sp. PLB05 TaxID=2899078 RepID=UPI001E37A107|nr:hypothetical protein [Pseudomonas sp. PLB05]MCD4867239.1 hypothetical protein [Pseudomonas sp. PLB05]